MKWKDRLRDALYIGLGLFLIGVLMLRADVTDTLDRMANIDLTLLLLVLLLYVVNTCTKALRWFALLKGMGAKKTGWVTAPIFLSSLALNNSTPGKVGGEPVRALLLKEHTDNRISVGIASIFAEKSFDIIMILAFSVIGMIYLVYSIGIDDVIGMVVLIALGGIVIVTFILLLTNRRFTGLLTGVTTRIMKRLFGKSGDSKLMRIVDRFEGSAEKFHSSLSNLRGDRPRAAGVIMLTAAIWINEALRLYLIVIALPGDVYVPFIGAVAAIAVANILGFILPIGSGNVLGGTSVLLLLTNEELLSTAASITAVATSIWISIPLGLVSLLLLRKLKGKGPRADRKRTVRT